MVKDPKIHIVDAMEQTWNNSCHFVSRIKPHHQQQSDFPCLVMLGLLGPVSK
jgi:hypothetical protein